MDAQSYYQASLITLCSILTELSVPGGEDVNIASFGGTLVTLGQKLMAASMPVVLASDQSNLPTNLVQVGGAAIALGQAASAASLPVTLATASATGLLKLEDAAHATGDAGVAALCVATAPATITSFAADGDYINPRTWVQGAMLVDINTTALPSTAVATSILKQADSGSSVFAAGIAGPALLGVRNQNRAVRTATEDRYLPLALDGYGAVYIDPNCIFQSGPITNYVARQPGDAVASNAGYFQLAGAARVDVPTADITTGSGQPLKSDVYGNLWTKIGGSPFTRIVTATTTTVKSGAGTLHRIVCNTAVANAVFTIYDNTAGSGTVIGIITEPATLLSNKWTQDYGLRFGTGLTIVSSSTEDITVIYS